MEYSNFNNEIQIILDIRDRRGKKLRVSTFKDIKIKVWTDNPDCYLSFNYNDIQQRSNEDVIVIPQRRMVVLQSGMISYQYTFKEIFPDCGGHHDIFRNQVVNTNIFWKNRFQNEVISNPSYFQSIEYLNDRIDREKHERIKQFKDLQYYVSEEYTNKLNDEVERATYREGELEALLNALSGTSENHFVELKDKIDSEVQRSNQVDIEMFKYIKEVESKLSQTDTKAEEDKKETDSKIDSTNENLTNLIDEETQRAKKAEKELDSKIDENVTKLNLKDVELNSSIEAEVTRAKGEETRIEALVNSSVENAKDQIKKLKKKVSGLEDSTDGLNSKLDKEISDRKIADNETTASINAEVSRAKTEEARIETKVNNNASNLESEVSRAKVVEKDITEALQALKALVKSLEGQLSDEIVRSQIEDDNIKRLIEILNGNEEVVGSILHSIKDSEHRLTDMIHELQDEFDEVIGGSLEDYASKVYVDERFNYLVGSAPEALDTLEEIAERLQRDDDLFKTIQELLSGKASKEDTYTKAEIDRKEADLQNAIQNEEQRATLVETGLTSQLATLSSDLNNLSDKVANHLNSADENFAEVKKQIVDETNRATAQEEAINNSLSNLNDDYSLFKEKVNQHIQDGDNNYQEVYNAILSETTRATNEETKLQNAIEIINGNEEVVGSVDHKISDLRHELEDKISEVESNFVIDTLSEYARKEEVYNKNEIDSKEGILNNAIQAEVQRATLVENGLTTQLEGVTSNLSALNDKVNNHLSTAEESLAEVKKQLSDEVTRATAKEEAINNSLSNLNDDYNSFKEKVNQHIQTGDANYQEINNSIVAEQTRATNEETKLQNQLDIINGNEEVIGSIAHAISDANHYTDDEIEKLKHLVDDNETNLNNHIEEANNKFDEYKTSMEQTIQELIERILTLEKIIDWNNF